MNKKNKISQVLVYIIIFMLCFTSFVYAAEPITSVTLMMEITETEQSDEKLLVERQSALLIPTNSVNNGWSFPTDGVTDGSTIRLTNGDKTASKIQIVNSAGEVVGTVPLVGNVAYSAEGGGYAIQLYSLLDNYGENASLTFQIIDEAGGVHDFVTKNLQQTTNTEEEPGILSFLWGLITDTTETVATMVEGILVQLILPIADGVIYMVSKSVGQVVTISRLIYNQVDRVSVDYWNIPANRTTVAGMMATVVVPWYNFFKQIAIIVCMMTLVVIGIKIMFSSTAEKKAKFQDALVSWVVGVAMLMFFPYVMKYVVVLNNTLVQCIYDYSTPKDAAVVVSEPAILTMEKKAARKTFGDTAFVENMLYEEGHIPGGNTIEASSINDSMLRVRTYAQYKEKIMLTVVYIIMIGQMVVVLFAYYKRAFMIAYLITLFPLVAMTYVIDKLGDKKAQSFEIWFKEFVVDVIVQLFHAVTYAVIVGISVDNYMKNDGSWLFMIISVLFLFEGEKILRGVFNAKSAANTIGDLAKTGVAIYGVAKGVKGLFGGGDNSATGSEQDKKDQKEISDRQEQRNNMQGNNPNPNAAHTPPGGGEGGADTSGSDGSYSGGQDAAGVGSAGAADMSAVKDEVLKSAMQTRTKRGLASRFVKRGAKIFGGALAATYGMSKGTKDGGSVLGNALTSAAVGSAIADTLASPVVALTNKVEQKARGNKVAKDIEKGNMDQMVAQSLPADVDPNEIIGAHGETVQEIYRQALAQMARVSSKKGKAKGEQAFWSYIDEHTKSS